MSVEDDNEERPQFGIRQAEKSSLNIPDVAKESDWGYVDHSAFFEAEGSVVRSVRLVRRVFGSALLGGGLILFFGGVYVIDDIFSFGLRFE